MPERPEQNHPQVFTTSRTYSRTPEPPLCQCLNCEVLLLYLWIKTDVNNQNQNRKIISIETFSKGKLSVEIICYY